MHTNSVRKSNNCEMQHSVYNWDSRVFLNGLNIAIVGHTTCIFFETQKGRSSYLREKWIIPIYFVIILLENSLRVRFATIIIHFALDVKYGNVLRALYRRISWHSRRSKNGLLSCVVHIRIFRRRQNVRRASYRLRNLHLLKHASASTYN